LVGGEQAESGLGDEEPLSLKTKLEEVVGGPKQSDLVAGEATVGGTGLNTG